MPKRVAAAERMEEPSVRTPARTFHVDRTRPAAVSRSLHRRRVLTGAILSPRATLSRRGDEVPTLHRAGQPDQPSRVSLCNRFARDPTQSRTVARESRRGRGERLRSSRARQGDSTTRACREPRA